MEPRGHLPAQACSPAQRKVHVRFALRTADPCLRVRVCPPTLQENSSRNPAELTQKHIPEGPVGPAPQAEPHRGLPCAAGESLDQTCPQSWGCRKAAVPLGRQGPRHQWPTRVLPCARGPTAHAATSIPAGEPSPAAASHCSRENRAEQGTSEQEMGRTFPTE